MFNLMRKSQYQTNCIWWRLTNWLVGFTKVFAGIVVIVTFGFVHCSLPFDLIVWKCKKFSTYKKEKG
ncbi:hypothetical protein LCGC14_0458420 [marine sediment metagenome]|uniref:Uncharacterized protein n=1 Tax=marine sediment metagenome TaxID=412755 RepID=A0A0F9VPH5_9ZZZZ